ncbi:MAG: hypothetical protein B7Y41_04415 [Hydrogenophilales bacterium 28-61-23]|nr:MAG: hypothetical protein B7Y41_04415 [Hydrogenophilales bacterium 28-61-23]
MAFENVGLVWTPESLTQYLTSIEKPNWCKAITLHHTAAPSLAQRPKGLLLQHIENLRHFYQDDKKWSAGPHLFVDDDQIFGMCDLRRKGVHAVSFNSMAIGIEVLGDYDSEDPLSGRGLDCWKTASATTRILLNWLGLAANKDTVLFHRDDPTTKKSCPGNKVKKDWLLGLIAAPASARIAAGSEKPDIGMDWAKWDYRGECWCVPVREFLVAKGIASKTVVAELKSIGGLFYYGNELLEGAYYVGKNSKIKPSQCTWAPARELMELL